MDVITRDLNFSGKYVLRGKSEQVDRAINTIKNVKGDKVDFFTINGKNNKLTIVATNEDATILRNLKNQEDFQENIKKSFLDKKRAIINMFQYLFSTSKNVPLIQDEQLLKFALPSYNIDFDNGTMKSKYKTEEKFIDGTIKKYTSRGRLFEIISPDGRKEEISVDGSRKITYPDSSIEMIPAKEINKSEKIPSKQINEIITTKTRYTPKEGCDDILDSKGRISKRFMQNDIIANYYYKDNSNEILFIYYSDGTFESKNGTVNELTGTISFPHKDGTRYIYNNAGIMESIIFPNGIRKNFDKNANLLDKIYPNGTVELFSPEGSLSCIVYPDGSKEFLRKNRPSVFL